MSSSTHPPLVSIGMPAFNGERYVRAAIESVLRQTYSNIELIVSDNASSDRTRSICAEMAASDPRIKLSVNERNVGAAENFRIVERAAQGRYFMWAGVHDLWHEELIERSVVALQAHPDAVIAGADCYWIDGNGDPLARQSGWTDTRGMSCVERFFTVMWGNMHPVLGLIRMDALRRTRGIEAAMGSDLVLLAELARTGDFIHVPGTHWYRRELRGQETYRQMLMRYRSKDYGISRGLIDRWFPTVSLASRLLQVAWHLPLSLTSRVLVCVSVVGSLPGRYIGARLRRR